MNEENLEHLSPEEWRQWHTELLQSTLNRIYQRVPFYRARLEETGLLPEDLRMPEDLSRFPATTREDLSAHYPYELFAVPLRDIVRLRVFPWWPNPIVKGYTLQDLENLRRLCVRFLKACGVAAEDILFISFEPGMAAWAEDIREAAEALGAAVIPPAPRTPEVSLRIMKDFRASVLVTTPSIALRYFRVCERRGLTPPASLRLLILVGEGLKASERTLLEEFFGAESRLGYGISEVLGPGLAYECEARTGLHLATDYIFPEVIDPEGGTPAEEGELVLTTLRVRANPLLRFLTGDRVKITFESCPCGRTTPRLVSIEAGSGRVLSFRGIKVPQRVLEGLLEKIYGKKPRYRIRIVGEEPDSELLVELIMEEALFKPSIVELHEEAHRFERAFFEFFGLPCRVKWVEA